MSTISISDLKKRTASQWRRSAKKGELIITFEGQPVAVLLPIDHESLGPTLSALRSVRALQAQSALQEAAKQNAAAALTMAEIDTEIAESRKSRRRK
jgi:prevent-host-death family protein